MKASTKITSGFGDWSVHDLALIAAEACYKPNDNDAERLAMQIVIESLVLDDDVAGYTIQDLAEAIVSSLTTKASAACDLCGKPLDDNTCEEVSGRVYCTSCADEVRGRMGDLADNLLSTTDEEFEKWLKNG